MLGWILAAMSADLIYTKQKELEAEELLKKKSNLSRRLKMPMTRGHLKNCRCLLCSNRKEAIITKLESL